MAMHQRMAAALDTVVKEIRGIQRDARANGFTARPRWPMIILRSPKGWTGPKVVDGKQTEGTFRSHQVPMGDMSRPGHVKILEKWLKSYRPQELFDRTDRLVPDLAALAPAGERRMSANPHANGGLLLRDLHLPDFRDYGERCRPGAVDARQPASRASSSAT
jgi:xylulose-5-phosphate/fructose-6-phosphate phosphoketolase